LIEKGFWTFAHEYRTDFSMTMLLMWLLIHDRGKILNKFNFFNSNENRNSLNIIN
jgi:hypothetical protein